MHYIGSVTITGQIRVEAGAKGAANRKLMEILARIASEFMDVSISTASLAEEDDGMPEAMAMAVPIKEEEAGPEPQGGGSKLKEQYGTFGKFLGQFMFDNGLGLTELANLLGVSATSVSFWRKDRKRPARKRWKDIARNIQDLSANEYAAWDIMALLKG